MWPQCCASFGPTGSDLVSWGYLPRLPSRGSYRHAIESVFKAAKLYIKSCLIMVSRS